MAETDAERYQNVCQYARQTAAMASIEALLGWDERTEMLPPARSIGRHNRR